MATSDFLLVVAKPCWQMGTRVNLQWLQLQPLIHSTNTFGIDRLIHPHLLFKFLDENIQDEKMIRTPQKQFIGCSAKYTIKMRGSRYHLAFEFRFLFFCWHMDTVLLPPWASLTFRAEKAALSRKTKFLVVGNDRGFWRKPNQNNRTCKDLGVIFRSD